MRAGSCGLRIVSEMWIVARDPVSKLVHAGLAHEHCAGLGQLSIDFGIAIGNAIGEDFRSAGGADAAGGEEIFQRIGNTVERAAIDAAREFFIGAPGLLEREFFGDGDECVEPRLGFSNAAERFLGQFNSRDFAGAKLAAAAFSRWSRGKDQRRFVLGRELFGQPVKFFENRYAGMSGITH